MINKLLVCISLLITIFDYSFSQQSVVDVEGVYLMCEKMPELIGGMAVSYTHLTLPTTPYV